jgi:hypothetical protein
MRNTLGYLHEVWLCPDSHGNALPACIPYGPDGDAARALNEPGSEWVWTFWASSHAEAMSIYYAFIGYGKYTTQYDEDRLLYPQAWYERQAAYLSFYCARSTTHG